MRDMDLPLDDLVRLLGRRAELHPDRPAIDFLGDGEQVTERVDYAGLDRRVRAMAALLQQHAAPGERALLLLPSGIDYAVAFLACLYAGVIAVPAYPPDAAQPQALRRLAGMAADAAPALALTDETGLRALARLGQPRHPGMKTLLSSDCTASPADWREHAPRPDDIAFLQYTSGSTSAPKGVMVSHANLLADKRSISATADERSEDRCFSWLPLFHDLGLILGLLQPLFYGLPLVLMSSGHFLERPRRWLEGISRHRASISGGPDFAYRLCAERLRPEAMAGVDLSCWRVAFSGAEPIRHATMQAFARAAAPLGFDANALNAWYGLAEATLVVSGNPRGTGMRWQAFDAGALERGIAQPTAQGTPLPACGATGAEVGAVIAQAETGELLPPGRVGEIWVHGPTVAQGYWRNEAATRSTFGARDAQGGGPYLRTGDLGFMHQGALFISSRLKDLIILRGRNIYPQDVEIEVETRVRGVRPGRVAAFALEVDGAEAVGIAAERGRLRPGEGDAADVVEAIRAAVSAALGEPVAAVALLKPGSLPKTSSGKLQRSACRQGWMDGTLELVASYRADPAPAAAAAPATPVERQLGALWSELLEIPHVGAGDSFFALGGQSLLMTRMVSRVRAAFGVELSLAQCFKAPTLAGLARLIEAAPRRPAAATEGEAGRLAARAPAAPGALLPLSYAQHRLWFLQSLQPGSGVYNVAARLAFSGPVDESRVRRALTLLVRRHEALRTSFVETDDGPRQRVEPDRPLPWTSETLEEGAADEPRLQARAAAFVAEAFDLARGPLLRGLWLAGGGAAPQLVLAMHHIVVDGSSLARLLADLAAAYAGDELPPAPLQVADHALWQLARMPARLPALAAAAGERLAAAPALSTLPPDFPRPARQSHRGASLARRLPAQLVSQLQDWTQRHDTTVFTALFAAYAWVLAGQSGQHDLVIGTDIANRQALGAEDIVGFFVNQLPVRCRWRPEMSGTQWLKATREALLAAYEVQDLPFDKLVEALRPARDLSHAPVFQTKFVLQDAPPAQPLGAGLAMHPQPLQRHTAELDLLFDLTRHQDRSVDLRIEYATDLYRRDTVERFASLFIVRLETWLGEAGGTGTRPAPPRPIARRAARGTSMEKNPT